MSIDQAAAKLKVQTEHVRNWIKSGLLRQAPGGIRPYDLNKFKLDCENEIEEARRKPVTPPPSVAKKPEKKGFFSALRRLLPGGRNDTSSAPSGKSSREKKLEAQLKEAKSSIRTLQKQVAEAGGGGSPQDLSEAQNRIRELTTQLAEANQVNEQLQQNRGAEAEERAQMLEIQLAQSEGLLRDAHQKMAILEARAESASGPDPRVSELEEQITRLNQELAEARDSSPTDEDPRLAPLEAELAQARQAVGQLQQQNERLSQQAGSAAAVAELEGRVAELQGAVLQRDELIQRLEAALSRCLRAMEDQESSEAVAVSCALALSQLR